jgi:hypothetical protein
MGINKTILTLAKYDKELRYGNIADNRLRIRQSGEA